LKTQKKKQQHKKRNQKIKKRHSQQIRLQTQGWGGARDGAGRPREKHSGVSHLKRDEIYGPGHVTMRLQDGLPKLRTKKAFHIFKKAVIQAKKQGLKVLHFAILGNHFHLIVEALDKKTLARGMKSLNTRLTLQLNKKLREGRKGTVFTDRYHLQPLNSPTQFKNALAYVLTNASKHTKAKLGFDPFSSVFVFKDLRDLKRLAPNFMWKWPENISLSKMAICYSPMLSPPSTWLAQKGWKRALA